MKSKKGTIILIIGVGAVVLVTFGIIIAFFSNTPEYKEIETITPEAVVVSEPYVEHIVNPDRELFDSETLVIAVLFENLISDNVSAYKRANPGVEIELISFSQHYERDGHLGGAQQEIAAAIMAGAGPVLIEGTLLDYRDPRVARQLADWFPVMWADPNFNEDDWFMNVFYAAAQKGRLYAFPTAFLYNIAVGNSNVPGVIEAVAEYDGVTMQELFDIYEKFKTDKPYYFESNFSLSTMNNYFIADYFDIETGRVDFNDEFVKLITYARGIMDPEFFEGMVYGPAIPSEVEQRWGENYLFHFANPAVSYLKFFDYETPPPFSAIPDADLTPIVSEHGELLMASWQSYILSAQASPTQQALAWDFLRFMMEPENAGDWVWMQPTNRHLMRHGVEKELPELIRNERLMISGTPGDVVEEVIAKMTAFGEMPMRNVEDLPSTLSGRPDGIFPTAFQLFEDGLVSAEDTAANLQNQVELVMMEMGI